MEIVKENSLGRASPTLPGLFEGGAFTIIFFISVTYLHELNRGAVTMLAEDQIPLDIQERMFRVSETPGFNFITCFVKFSARKGN